MSRVRGLYDDLGVLESYKVYEEESYRNILSLIDRIAGDGERFPPAVFNLFLAKIYRRKI